MATNIGAAVGEEERRLVETDALCVLRSLTHGVESATHATEDRTSLLDLRRLPRRGD